MSLTSEQMNWNYILSILRQSTKMVQSTKPRPMKKKNILMDRLQN